MFKSLGGLSSGSVFDIVDQTEAERGVVTAARSDVGEVKSETYAKHDSFEFRVFVFDLPRPEGTPQAKTGTHRWTWGASLVFDYHASASPRESIAF